MQLFASVLEVVFIYKEPQEDLRSFSASEQSFDHLRWISYPFINYIRVVAVREIAVQIPTHGSCLLNKAEVKLAFTASSNQ